ncbi:MAG: alginate lyase family protein [Pseudomonadota bacterium]
MTLTELCDAGRHACLAILMMIWGPSDARVPPDGIWLSQEELLALPDSGPAWEALYERASNPTGPLDLSDQDSAANVNVLAKALVYARTGSEALRAEVRTALLAVRGSEAGATALAVGRELAAYVIAADLIDLQGDDRDAFEAWLRQLQRSDFSGRTLRSTHEDRPNNWGTHAGASRIAVAAYLGDEDELDRAAYVFRGWLGDEVGWRDFRFGERWWQPAGSRDFAVNPPGAERDGHSIDGVLPDDQRRGGEFRWPPPRENYVYEALQGALTQAQLLERQGYQAWQWGDQALLRAYRWLHEQADYPVEGDDGWQPYLVNRAYGTEFPAPVPAQPGKGMGFTDWTHGSGNPQP